MGGQVSVGMGGRSLSVREPSMDSPGLTRSEAASTSSSAYLSISVPSPEPSPSSARPAKANPEQVARLSYLMVEMNTKVGEGTPTSVLELEEFMMLSRTMGIDQVKAAIAAANLPRCSGSTSS